MMVEAAPAIYILIMQTVCMIYMICPDGMSLSWQRLRKLWREGGARFDIRRRRTRKNNKRYVEINVPKPK